MHVHLREPGATHKEDFASGSRAAVAGGFTFVCDMPNNYDDPTITTDRLKEKIRLSREKSLIDIGFHFGTDGKNLDHFAAAASSNSVFGLKIYCGETTGNLAISDQTVLDRIFAAWKCEKPILVHAEGELLAYTVDLAATYHRRIHVCHVSSVSDLETVQKAKSISQPVTCGVTPHHLFLTEEHLVKLGPYGLVKPPVGSGDMQAALWDAVASGLIDIIESDHAPHTREEKESGTEFFGVPGLETTLGLLFLAKKQGRITTEQIVTMLYERPMRIFSVPPQEDTYIEVDMDAAYIAGKNGYKTKSGWSPFDGWELYGRVDTVVLRGKPLVAGGSLV